MWLNSNQTLKKGILIAIDVSKELAYYFDSKFIAFIKFRIHYSKLRAWENLPDFQKRGMDTP